MAKKNWAISTVATAPSPATTGTSLVVETGHGARFADDEPAIVFPEGEQPDSTNAEIVMITNISTDTFTITREQESTSARTIIAGDIIMQGFTAKDWNDLVLSVIAKIPQIDCSGGTSDTYGVLTGLVNGSNALYTVSNSAYRSGSLKVFLNGQLQTQGSGEDWVETTPASGTFTFATAPATGDIITVEYLKS